MHAHRHLARVTGPLTVGLGHAVGLCSRCCRIWLAQLLVLDVHALLALASPRPSHHASLGMPLPHGLPPPGRTMQALQGSRHAAAVCRYACCYERAHPPPHCSALLNHF